MNVWLGVITLIFILITGVFILLKHKKIGSVLWNILLFIVSFVALWFGGSSKELWLILLCSTVMGCCLLIAVVHSYNKLISTGKVNESVGEIRRPKTFGNGYWK